MSPRAVRPPAVGSASLAGAGADPPYPGVPIGRECLVATGEHAELSPVASSQADSLTYRGAAPSPFPDGRATSAQPA